MHSTRTICWRVLDAQYFGVAQRRKRVFLVASARKRSVA
ncbi:DNA cytosine methyltransferase, partial [Pasteurella multocida]